MLFISKGPRKKLRVMITAHASNFVTKIFITLEKNVKKCVVMKVLHLASVEFTILLPQRLAFWTCFHFVHSVVNIQQHNIIHFDPTIQFFLKLWCWALKNKCAVNWVQSTSHCGRNIAKCIFINALINSTLAECSTFMVLHHCALFHTLAAIGFRVIKIIVKKN